MSVLIAGNWKMHKGPGETAAFCAGLWERIGELEGVDVVLAPPFVSLRQCRPDRLGRLGRDLAPVH